MRRKVLSTQNVSRMCLVCGLENRAGLRARFYELDDGELAGVFTPSEEHQSYPGRLHGGIVSTILDETMGRAVRLTQPDAWGVTAELTVRFRRPVPLAEEVRVVGRVTRDTSRVFEGTAEVILGDGTVAAEATGRYVKMRLQDITESALNEREWFEDPRPGPGHIEL